MSRKKMMPVCFPILSLLLLFAAHLSAAEERVVHFKPLQRSAPISEYIYGQFIEHFGNCIDTGLWSEIVRDRKFFDAVGTGESPWQVSGAELLMDESEPFTGKWSPALTISGSEPGILKQGPLQFRSDVDFDGYLWVAPSEEISRIEVSLVIENETLSVDWDAESGDFVPNEYQKLPFTFEAGNPEPFQGDFCITIEGEGTIHIGCVSLMPSDNVFGMRADTLECLKELNSPIYRWPGGNFVSGYDWKDGIGNRDRRPPRKNPAWPGIEMNDFGFDEFLLFCDIMKTEPYIAVNTGNGTAAQALEELEYALGSPKTPFGKLRAENGHKKPYAIRFWGIGNEMYGDWQIGHIPVADYVKKNNEFADAFRAAYPDLCLIGVGNAGSWNDEFIPGAIGHIDVLSEHFYCGKDENLQFRVHQIANEIKRIADAHKKYQDRWPDLYAQNQLPIAMDEWNYAGGETIFGQAGIRFDLADGLGTAVGLHEFFRHSELFFMANYAQTINVLGAVKTTPTAAELESTGVVLALYRKIYGSLPIAVQVTGNEDAVIDAAAAFTEDERFLTVGLVNTSNQEQEIRFDPAGIPLGHRGTLWRVTDAENDPAAFNDPGTPRRITVSEEKFLIKENRITLPCYSVTILKLPVKTVR